MRAKHVVKFRYCGNKIKKNLPSFLKCQNKVGDFFQIVEAFSEYLNFSQNFCPNFTRNLLKHQYTFKTCFLKMFLKIVDKQKFNRDI